MFRFNYGEYIFQQLITSEFIKEKLTGILISLATNIFNLHIVSIICAVVSIHPYIDFFLQIGVSVFMALNIDYLYGVIDKYHQEFHELTQYLINNYTIENYKWWKKIVVLSVCGYACIGLLFIDVTNTLLYVYIGQYAICFLIIEQFEQQRIQKFIQEYKEKPKTQIDDPALEFLIDSYIAPKRVKRPTPVRPVVRFDSGKSTKPHFQQGLTDLVKSNYNLRKRLG